MSTWDKFLLGYRHHRSLQLVVDTSRVDFPARFRRMMAPRVKRAIDAMQALEQGAIANPDEERMVGHYWLRNPALAPKTKKPGSDIGTAIRRTIAQIKRFAAAVHAGRIRGQGGRFTDVLVIGIGGSALGPQFVSQALGHPDQDRVALHFFDNTDPDGMDRVLARLGKRLNRTLCIVISKSGSTKETENGMKEAAHAYKAAKLSFSRHAVAITVPGSKLSEQAKKEGWLDQFAIWDWVGGRTSQTSAVGLLPAALQGLNIDQLLAGAKACDDATRENVEGNPAVELALAWYHLGEGKGAREMVVLPYKDRLELFSRYLQQLVMESLGKECDLKGRVVKQGLTVFGNKGSTDQHAYIQQLRDGLDNFFVVFIEVLKDRAGQPVPVGAGVTSGDYLEGFLLGTRRALYENGRKSLTLTLDEVSPFTVGVLIALFERAVGLYAQLIQINAYHQPGVQAGKVAADKVLKLQQDVVAYLAGYAAAQQKLPATAAGIAKALGVEPEAETVFKICEHLAANPDRGVRCLRGHRSPAEAIFAKA